jgi:oligoribonuclease (3'-5' exoribonuclease)
LARELLMSRLKLTRPLICFDLETTGVNTRHDRIVEICVVKTEVDGSQTVKTRRLNPTIPIAPARSTASPMRTSLTSRPFVMSRGAS